jgi:helix-turn-helix protein
MKRIKELLAENGIVKVEINNPNFKNCRFYKIKEFNHKDVTYNLILVITDKKTKFVILFKGNICVTDKRINEFEKIFFLQQMDDYLKSREFQNLIPLLSDLTKNEIRARNTEEILNLILANGKED